MAETADILIIGGGVMGASIAYHLAKEGSSRIVLLERQAICNGTTGRSGAIVRQHYSNDFTMISWEVIVALLRRGWWS